MFWILKSQQLFRIQTVGRVSMKIRVKFTRGKRILSIFYNERVWDNFRSICRIRSNKLQLLMISGLPPRIRTISQIQYHFRLNLQVASPTKESKQGRFRGTTAISFKNSNNFGSLRNPSQEQTQARLKLIKMPLLQSRFKWWCPIRMIILTKKRICCRIWTKLPISRWVVGRAIITIFFRWMVAVYRGSSWICNRLKLCRIR